MAATTPSAGAKAVPEPGLGAGAEGGGSARGMGESAPAWSSVAWSSWYLKAPLSSWGRQLWPERPKTSAATRLSWVQLLSRAKLLLF